MSTSMQLTSLIPLIFVLLLVNTNLLLGQDQSKDQEEKAFKIAAIPTIDYSRSLGLKLGFIGMGFFRPNSRDTISPISSVGVIGMWSTNKSWVAMAYSQFFFGRNRHRVKLAGGLAAFNYQFYEDQLIPGGIFIDFNTSSDFIYLQYAVRTWKQLFVGVQGVFSNRATVFDIGIPVGEEDTRWFNGMGAVVEWDSRSNVYNAKSGLYGKISNFSYRDWLGSEVEFDNLQLEVNKYFSIREDQVLALRAFGYFSLGDDIPFEGQRTVGRDDIRGYTQGEFRGNQMADIQGEYRWTFHDRWGMVGFLGLAAAFDPNDWSGLLPGGGAGIRYLMIPERSINVGIDLALGIRDWGIYFRVTEAF